MLSVSSAYHAAEIADVNKPVAKVYLLLGNYATPGAGASATASGAATDYPASGAINGQRTELNIGPASGADDDVGQASWKSSVAPSTTPQTLKVDFGQSRTFNRLKLFHRSSHALYLFKFSWSNDDSSYTDFAGTTGYHSGTNEFSSTQRVDTVDLTADITARYLKLTVQETAVALDTANVTALEVYRKLDITSRVTSVKVQRSRDFQLNNALASTLQVTCSNVDKFFSPNHTPTTAEVADGFVNSELQPGLGILVKHGYDYGGSQEYAQTFIGSVDRFSVKPLARTTTIEARDGMKATFNRIVSTKLKSSTDIGTLVQYMVNKANISSWESSIDTTGITVDYFFSFDEVVIATIRKLVEAAGDAAFYFDESGIATFKSYIASTPLTDTDTGQSDFETGTLTNIDTTSVPGKISKKWFPIDTFADAEITTNPAWTQHNGSGSWAVVSGALNYPVRTSVADAFPYNIATPLTQVTGTWRTKAQVASIASGLNSVYRFYFMAGTYNSSTRNYINSYYIKISKGIANGVGLWRTDAAGSETNLANSSDDVGTTYKELRVTRNSSGVINVYLEQVLIITYTDTNITSSTNMAFAVEGISTVGPPPLYNTGSTNFDDVYYSPTLDGTSTFSSSQAVYESAAIDQGSTISAEGIFQATVVTPASTSLAYYTATSADNVTYDAYVATSLNGAILSTARRYIKVKVVFTTPSDDGNHNVDFTTPTVTDVSVSWSISSGTGSGGSQKYPTSVSFTFDESLNMDIEQIYADTVGGNSSIINYASVKAQPLVLSGANGDVQWQGTTGTPPVAVSASDPVNVTNGDILTYPIVVSGGMDTSRMSGANPAAGIVTFASSATGSWIFSSIHPTRPVLQITITHSGTITALQVQGKTFANDDTLLEKTASDTDSIQNFDERRFEVSNEYIVNSLIAQAIATRLVLNFADPTTYIPQIKVRPTFSVQIGDRVTVQDENLHVSEDSIVTGVEHNLSATLTGFDVVTTLKLLKIAV
jgi:hypothetical protein